ncbi:MAG TPA: ABC transporter permease [Vicinamibacterales bacterium]|nr:ABC transporter permease [Vicinamibacterales bacterium]
MLLRLVLRAGEYERALADLADVHAAVADERNPRAANRACRREALSIVLWSLADRVRRRFEAEPRRMSRLQPTESLMLGSLPNDVRFAWRSLRRRPGFSLMVTGVVALGVGANVAIFTLVNDLFLRPPPLVESAAQLFRVFRSSSAGYGASLSFPDYRDYREEGTAVADLVASSGTEAATGRIRETQGQFDVEAVSDNYFGVLGVLPAAGRSFRPHENASPGTHPVAMISWRLWQDAFAGEGDAVGDTIRLNGIACTVVGVVPRGFRGVSASDQTADIYVPLMMYASLFPQRDESWRVRLPGNQSNWLQVIGRLKPGASIQEARTALTTIAARIYPPGEAKASRTVFVTPRYRWYPSTFDSLARLTQLMMLAVLVLLAVAVVNVIVLFLARASARRRDIGVLTALGAARARIVRQFLIESSILGLAGGTLGFVGAAGAARVASSLLPVRMDVPSTPDWRVLMFTLALALVTASVVGVVPGLRAARLDVVGQVRGRGRRAAGGRLRDGLIVLQVALSLILVAGAALFARSLSAARAVDPGFDPSNTLLVSVNLGTRGYDRDRGRAFLQTALERVAAMPGVRAVSSVTTVPFRGQWSTMLKPWPGSRLTDSSGVELALNAVAPEYFTTIGIPLVNGRPIDRTDRVGAPEAVVVNETLATMAFGTTDAVGRTIPLAGADGPEFTVVGVARDSLYFDFQEDPWPVAYLSAMQHFQLGFTVIAKTADDPTRLTGPVTAIVRDLDSDLPIDRVETLQDVYEEQLAGFRASANVVGLSGLVALVLAGVGLYGVMAFRVAERTRVIGICLALGATRRRIAADVLRRGLRLTVVGGLLGMAGALVLGRFLRGLIYGVGTEDPVSLIAAPVVLVIVAMIAVLVPARRAMRVDPIRAMRTDEG